MSKIEKTLGRFKARAKDISWSELTTIMNHFGYYEKKGSGSRRKFIHSETKRVAMYHKRHPDDTLLPYQVKDTLDFLEGEEDT